MRGTFLYVDRVLAARPAEGHCYVNRWWAVDPDRGVSFYWDRGMDEPAPQCNQSEDVAKQLTRRLQPNCTAEFIPVVFAAHGLRVAKEFAKASRQKRTVT